MSYLEIKKLYKKFKKEEILKDINLEVKKGEFFVVLGPSGCGKTTLLKIIAGLLKPDKGKIILEENDITNLEPGKRDVAMVFQNYALYPHMKVMENILFPLKIKKIKIEEQRKRLKWVSEFLKIEEILEKKPSEISGGQQQRVALARALVRNPKIFLMDEPLSNLDAKLRTEMRSELKNLHRNLNITTIYVTHDQIEAMTLADKICILNKGEIMQIGTPEEIYEKPQNFFVASFIGTHGINIIESENFILCVRPEKFYLARQEGKNYEFYVRLNSYDFIGEYYVLKCDIVDVVFDGSHIDTKKGEIKVIMNRKPEYRNIIFYVREKDVYRFDRNKLRLS
ncbi:MAG: ABC transporter ATP-binding protein [candidate division WOR-3 bacterium]